MGTTKRQRQKQARRERLEAEARATRRRRLRRRILVFAVLGAILLAVLLLLSGGGDSDEVVADGTTTTTGEPGAAGEGEGSTDQGDADDSASGEFVYGDGECPPEGGTEEQTLEFDGPPPRCIDPEGAYAAVFDTTEGAIRVRLDTERTPGTVNNFVFLARHRYYDGTLIHRTDPSIDIIQGGAPHTDSASDPGPGYTITDEGSGFTYEPGDLVMARTAAPDSASAQFFFVAGPGASQLEAQGTYVVFGEVTEGLDVVEEILTLHADDPDNPLGGAPDPPVTVEAVRIERLDPAE